MQCEVCPHYCSIDEGQVGRCQIYANQNGQIANLYRGKISTMTLDPIEKRPFFHFLPGQKTLAIGYYGCNLTCSFCQNFKISQNIGNDFTSMSYQSIILKCLEKNINCISFTYNEPLMYYEDIIDIAKLAKQNNIKIAVKTNGFISPVVWEAIYPAIDAINVDIKGDNLEYNRICGGSLDPVLSTIELICQSSVHLEISYLVLPRLLDDFDFHLEIAEFLRILNPCIPIHVLRYIPFYKMTEPAYADGEYLKVIELLRKYMKYVYSSNCYGSFWNSYRETTCEKCGFVYISRKSTGIVNNITCSCGDGIYGIMQ